MKKPAQHLIAEVPRRQAKVEMTIGIDLGDVWSHYCTLNQDGEVVDRGRFRTAPKAIEKWFTDLPPARVAIEAGTHSIWISAKLQELGHEGYEKPSRLLTCDAAGGCGYGDGTSAVQIHSCGRPPH
jgi:transposase